MFTGIIENCGKLDEIQRDENKARFVITFQDAVDDLELGESIAINGVCLTVVKINAGTFAVDLSTETLNRTSFDKVQERERVNLERSLTANKKMNGHFVMGHVDAVGTIVSIDHQPGEILIRFSHPPDLAANFIEKGSVAVDGISLTVFDCRENQFTVSIIPFTWEHTNLNQKSIGDSVNLECDMIGKYILKACEAVLRSKEETS